MVDLLFTTLLHGNFLSNSDVRPVQNVGLDGRCRLLFPGETET